jgi:Fe-S-cluster-containing dehydrogenase component
MARYGIVIDTAECMACYNCFVACRDEHCGFDTAVSKAQPHSGQTWMRIDEEERGDDRRLVKTSTVATPCLHCKDADAPCKKASSGGAVYTRPDGIVIIDSQKSKGQKQIVDACPIGAVYWNDELEIPQKCTMCVHLLDEGYLMPRCVEACPNGALFFGDLDDPNSEVSKKISEGKVTPISNDFSRDAAVIHLNIQSLFAGGSVYLPDDEVADGAKVSLQNSKTEETKEAQTNYFGDFIFDDLTAGAEYEVRIEFEGYETKTFKFIADIDHYLGEIILAEKSLRR